MKRTPRGFVAAVAVIKQSQRPVILYWRIVLRGRAYNHCLALPTYHARPSRGVVVGTYCGADFAEIPGGERDLVAMVRQDLRVAQARYERYGADF